jgi:hypothetical protein
MRQTFGKTKGDGIAADGGHDRDAARCIHERTRRRRGGRDDGVGPGLDQFNGALTDALVIVVAEININPEVLALGPTQLSQPQLERGQTLRGFRIVFGSGVQESDPSYPIDRLGERADRPRR